MSDYYVDMKSIHAHPAILRAVARAVAKLIPESATCIAATGYGGIPLGSVVAMTKRLPLTLVREKPKEYGRRTWLDGYVPTKADRIVLVDDVYTTGKSIRAMERIIRTTGARVSARIVIANRSEKALKSVRSLVDVAELL